MHRGTMWLSIAACRRHHNTPPPLYFMFMFLFDYCIFLLWLVCFLTLILFFVVLLRSFVLFDSVFIFISIAEKTTTTTTTYASVCCALFAIRKQNVLYSLRMVFVANRCLCLFLFCRKITTKIMRATTCLYRLVVCVCESVCARARVWISKY